jgi:hypothetical protein
MRLDTSATSRPLSPSVYPFLAITALFARRQTLCLVTQLRKAPPAADRRQRWRSCGFRDSYRGAVEDHFRDVLGALSGGETRPAIVQNAHPASSMMVGLLRGMDGEDLRRLGERLRKLELLGALVAISLVSSVAASYPLFKRALRILLNGTGSHSLEALIIPVGLCVLALVRDMPWLNLVSLEMFASVIGGLHSSGDYLFLATSILSFLGLVWLGDIQNQTGLDYLFVRAWTDERPPVLCLRSYQNDRLSYAQRTSNAEDDRVAGYAFAACSSPHLNLGLCIALGREETIPGTRNILFLQTEESSWRAVIGHLADISWPIFFIPETTKGLTSELLFLIRGQFLSKCLVLMAPAFERIPQPSEIEKRWREVQSEWQSVSVRLPDYDPAGMIYLPNKDLSIDHSWSLDHKWKLEIIRDAVAELGRRSGKKGVSMAKFASDFGLAGEGNHFVLKTDQFRSSAAQPNESASLQVNHENSASKKVPSRRIVRRLPPR